VRVSSAGAQVCRDWYHRMVSDQNPEKSFGSLVIMDLALHDQLFSLGLFGVGIYAIGDVTPLLDWDPMSELDASLFIEQAIPGM
jgi:hypothetical protein